MTTLLPGTLVSARGLQWEVVFSQSAGEETLYRLRCQEGTLRGSERDFLSPFETLEPVSMELRPERAAPLADWRLFHQAFLLDQALGPAAFQAVQPGRLTIQPYQLVPVMRALRMSRARLLLADGVGLGKTVEAGLVLAELIARRRAHRILIVSPAGPLLQQWRREMRDRFGLRFRVLDRDSLQEIRFGSELTSNPFAQVSYGLISIDFAKQEPVLQQIEGAQWDVVVIDEAHHCVRLGNAGDRDDSQRRRLAETLSRRTDALLLLTATPHDGFDPHFASLVELLDPSLVDGRGNLRGEVYRRHVVRRLKSHVKAPRTGAPLLPERHVPFSKEGEPIFSELQERLLGLVAPRLRSALRQKRYDDVFSFLTLLKRSVSTVAACRTTLAAVGRRLGQLQSEGLEREEAKKQRFKTLRALERQMARFGTLSAEDEAEHAGLEAEEIAAELAEQALAGNDAAGLARDVRRDHDRLSRLEVTRRGLEELERLAAKAEAEDPKLRRLVEEIGEIRAAERGANVLVFTEYADSQGAAVERLRAAVAAGQLVGEVLSLTGLSADEGGEEQADLAKARERILSRFSRADGLILVTTDTSAEGLNLHERCHHLLHVELPYNPNRLEQRNGRIDRYGQKKEPVVRYLYLAGTFEERLLLRLVSKWERQRERLTFVPNTLGVVPGAGSGAVRLLEGIVEEEGLLFTPAGRLDFASGKDEDATSAPYRELLEEVDRAFSGFEKAAKTHAWLAEAGLGAEASTLNEAETARSAGSRLASPDLVSFVLDAVRADSGDPNAVRAAGDGLFDLRLPPDWRHGLDELPGWDPKEHLLHLTTNPDRTSDDSERSLGYLGRAHPIVRRALDRVRQSRFGAADEVFDRRVGVARFDEHEPAILFTFVARLASGAGAELERVVAVLRRRDGRDEPLLDPNAWSPLVSPGRAIPPAGAWKRNFAPWADGAADRARAAAGEAFAPEADAFRAAHAEELSRERESLLAWLKGRVAEITGTSIAPRQGGLFAEAEGTGPGWAALSDPSARLASFAVAEGVPSKARHEAEGVLRLLVQRLDFLDRRARLEPLVVEPLGMLLLVPAAPTAPRAGA
jgi:hypothetical protein